MPGPSVAIILIGATAWVKKSSKTNDLLNIAGQPKKLSLLVHKISGGQAYEPCVRIINS